LLIEIWKKDRGKDVSFTFLWGVIVLKPRLDGLVLFVEESHVRHEVLDDIHCDIEEVSAHWGGTE